MCVGKIDVECGEVVLPTFTAHSELESKPLRIMVDSASQANFISEEAAKNSKHKVLEKKDQENKLLRQFLYPDCSSQYLYVFQL